MFAQWVMIWISIKSVGTGAEIMASKWGKILGIIRKCWLHEKQGFVYALSKWFTAFSLLISPYPMQSRPFPSFCRHLGWGSVGPLLLYNRFWQKSCLLIWTPYSRWHPSHRVEAGQVSSKFCRFAFSKAAPHFIFSENNSCRIWST